MFTLPPYRVNVGTNIPRLKFMVAVCDPEVPVMVNGYWPVAALLLAVNFKVLWPVVGLGENDAVTPAGKPDMERFTLPVNPYCGLT